MLSKRRIKNVYQSGVDKSNNRDFIVVQGKPVYLKKDEYIYSFKTSKTFAKYVEKYDVSPKAKKRLEWSPKKGSTN